MASRPKSLVDLPHLGEDESEGTVRSAVRNDVRRSLAQEARANEIRLGIVRAVGYALLLAIDAAMVLLGVRAPVAIANSLVPAGVAALLLYALIKAPPFRGFAYLVPAVDAAILVAVIVSRERLAVTDHTTLTAPVAAAMALFAATGGIRFERLPVIWTALLATAALWVLQYGHAPVQGLVYATPAILAIGLWNLWSAALVRRSMEASGSRAVLQRFLPGELVEKSFTDPMGLFVPRAVDATVMVTDLRGFTRLAETKEPAEVLALLSEFQGALAAAVQQHGGTVDKFMGDGMLAVFGAVEPLPDHAARAVAAVREVRAAVERLNRQAAGREPLKIGAGVHSGKVVVGCLGGSKRLEFTILGDTVNTASRLESLTKDRGTDVLVSEETVRRARLSGGVRDLGEVALRGRAQPLRLFALVDGEAEKR